jgi:hypothetical protein
LPVVLRIRLWVITFSYLHKHVLHTDFYRKCFSGHNNNLLIIRNVSKVSESRCFGYRGIWICLKAE